MAYNTLWSWILVCVVEGAADLDCGLRRLVFDHSMALLGSGANHRAIADALQLGNCKDYPEIQGASKSAPHCALDNPAPIQVWVSASGSDLLGTGAGDSPFSTLLRARDEVRKLRALQSGLPRADIIMHAGLYPMVTPLQLDESDSFIRIFACPGDRVILSGAKHYPQLAFRRSAVGSTKFVAQLPDSLKGVDQLFVRTTGDEGVGTRLVWAREPNGNAELDLQPQGYALADQNPLGSQPAPAGAGPYESIWAAEPRRNNTWFPVYGKDNDPRGGGVSLHTGSEAAMYKDHRDFWNQTMPAGLQWSSSSGTSHGIHTTAFNASGWPATTRQRPLLHCMHQAEWGNHVWEVEHVNVTSRTIRLGRGGWQEARYALISKNPFYVEGASAALDQAGEWWHDEATGQLWLIPNITVEAGTNSILLDVAIPMASVLVNMTGSDGMPIKNVTLQGLTLAYTRRTLMDEYVVPSPGDWSVHPGGVVTASAAESVAIVNCTFNRTGGNSIVFFGGVDKSVISGCEMEFIGDSAVVLIGKLSGLGNDGSNSTATLQYPRDTLITQNHIHDIGIWGKQTAALFQAVACRTTFSKNVAYNGPRAGLNINDGFCGGHHVDGNVLFNWVRETQDHGPINTWDRATYKQPDGSLYPAWSRIVRNLIMNGPSGNRDLGNLFPAVDNDDGSAYYWIAENVVAYGGFKNFLGNDKVWIDNLILYPEGRSDNTGNGPCVMAWGGANEVYQNNTCVTRGSGGPGVDSYPTGKCSYKNESIKPLLLELSRNTYYNPAAKYELDCEARLSLSQAQALGIEIGSRVDVVPSAVALLDMAAALLGFVPASSALHGSNMLWI